MLRDAVLCETPETLLHSRFCHPRRAPCSAGARHRCHIQLGYHSKYSEAGLAQSKMWPAGTLCITIAANIADSAMLGFDACFPDSVVGFIPCEPLSDTRYFLAFMKTARENLLKFAPSTAQKNINLEILESVLIPLPPLKEIFRIVAKVDELMALCDTLKARLADAQAIQLHLADAIVEQTVC